MAAVFPNSPLFSSQFRNGTPELACSRAIPSALAASYRVPNFVSPKFLLQLERERNHMVPNQVNIVDGLLTG